jgi:site-specific DNA-methyltransferase (adenine-specific)
VSPERVKYPEAIVTENKQDRKWTLLEGDCLEVLKTLPENSVDAIVTDPPAGIAFMGNDWDRDKGGRDAWVAWMTDVARECLRVIKPGGHALVWAIPRTSHWTGWAWEDGGWEPRDKIVHLFGSGFPKGLDVSKAIDKAAGAEREIIGKHLGTSPGCNMRSGILGVEKDEVSYVTAPATEDAKRWSGWNTALKPASEDWWLFRKPLVGTVAENIQNYGTGAINIDGCRIPYGDEGVNFDAKQRQQMSEGSIVGAFGAKYLIGKEIQTYKPGGRWPANVSLGCECAGEGHEETCSVRMLDEQTSNESSLYGEPDSGNGASRFFYTAKASRSEKGKFNIHPTVKPLSLMRWLVRLVCPPDGVVLDVFSGSGTTGVAALAEGIRSVLIERDPRYLDIIQRRLNQSIPEWLQDVDSDDSVEETSPKSLDDLLGIG